MGDIRNTAAENSNLQNLSGRAFLSEVAAKGTTTIENIIPAGLNQYFPCTGSFFYIEAASGLVKIAPDCALGRGPENPYETGTGLNLNLANSFKGLQIKNPDQNNSLFFRIKVGFDQFIDNRLIYPSLNFKQVPVQTFSVYRPAYPNGAVEVLVPDLSGTVITDNNGNQWYAVNRQLLCLFNNDASSYWFVTNTAGTKDEGSAQPLTSVQLPVSGNLRIVQGSLPISGEPVNGVVSEIYNCLPKLGV